jgi:hypothetical protein
MHGIQSKAEKVDGAGEQRWRGTAPEAPQVFQIVVAIREKCKSAAALVKA